MGRVNLRGLWNTSKFDLRTNRALLRRILMYLHRNRRDNER